MTEDQKQFTGSVTEVIQWQIDRNLHLIPFKENDDATNILEELVETFGLTSSEARVEARAMIEQLNKTISQKDCICAVMPEDYADAYFDVIVYAVGSLLKLGFNPIGVLQEGLKHIDGRKGKYDPEIGKYVKEPSGHLYRPQYQEVTLEKMPLQLPILEQSTEEEVKDGQ
jgi:hypothetical protein